MSEYNRKDGLTGDLEKFARAVLPHCAGILQALVTLKQDCEFYTKGWQVEAAKGQLEGQLCIEECGCQYEPDACGAADAIEEVPGTHDEPAVKKPTVLGLEHLRTTAVRKNRRNPDTDDAMAFVRETYDRVERFNNRAAHVRTSELARDFQAYCHKKGLNIPNNKGARYLMHKIGLHHAKMGLYGFGTCSLYPNLVMKAD